MRRSSHCLTVVVATVLSSALFDVPTSLTAAEAPQIRKLGTIECGLVEATPLVFKERLYRFEYVRQDYPGNSTGSPYFRLIDVAAGKATPAFAKGYHLGCAHAEGDFMYTFGVKKWGQSEIAMFKSSDLVTWEKHEAISLPGWQLFNSSVCKAGERYVMAIEVGAPPEVAGTPFTMRFAESKDLATWKLLPEECVFSKDRYTACGTIRHVGDYFYMIYLEAKPGPPYQSYIVRSKDLMSWETSRFNPVLAASADDKNIANPQLTAEQRDLIAKAVNINNSDVDLCEFAGKTHITYSWGNQQGTEFLALAVYEGRLADLLEGFFRNDVRDEPAQR